MRTHSTHSLCKYATPAEGYRACSPNRVAWQRLLWGGLLFFVLLTTACKGCGEEIIRTDSGTAVVTPNPISFPQVAPGDMKEIRVTVRNVADDPLSIYAVAIESREGGSTAGLSVDGFSGSQEMVIKPQERANFIVRFKPTPTTPEPKAYLKLDTSDPNYSKENPLKINIYTVGTQALVNASPDPLRFSKVAVGRKVSQRVMIRNVGSRDLVLTKMPTVAGSSDFKVGETSLGSHEESGSKFPVTLKPYDKSQATGNKAEYEFEVEVIYAPTGAVGEVSEGSLAIYYKSEGASQEKEHSVPIVTSTSGPLIFVYPLTRNFGQVPVGKMGGNSFYIQNNGTEPLTVSDIILSKNTPQDEFSLSPVGVPLTIPAGDKSQLIELHYQPTEEGIDTGEVIIKSNDTFQPELPLTLIGRGAIGLCPVVSVGGYVEGLSATPRPVVLTKPLDYVILDGTASHDDDGEIKRWEWHVTKKPAGASSTLEPLASDTTNTDFSKRRYRPLVAGDYEISLNVVDNEGFSGCAPQTVKLKVTPAKKIHIELTWTNPEDPDESDSLGSDVDLHMVKLGQMLTKNGPGRWFKAPYDIYFKNKTVFWDPERPTLDLDDRDGAGPENIQLDNPIDCGWYAIGVDYFKQLYGTAYVTVRVYINQQLVAEYLNLPLTKQESFFDIARIHWKGSQGTLYEVNRFYERRPLGEEPAAIPEMSTLCSAEQLFP